MAAVALPWSRNHTNVFIAMGAGGALLFVIAAFGGMSDRWGYGLLVLSGLPVGAGMISLSLLVFTDRYDAGVLFRWFVRLSVAGVLVYAWGTSALGGFFVYETFQGRMELTWILFGPAALAALIVLDVGLYRKLVPATARSWATYGGRLSRADAEPEAARRAFVDEVVVQRTLRDISGLRWWRHTLIFWGFVAMFATELSALFFREVAKSYGFTSVWAPNHPLRLAHDLAFEITGLIVLVGCILALIWRATVNGKPEQRYSDTPTVVFLLVIVLSGFFTEALRLSSVPAESHLAFSFVGYFVASAVMSPGPLNTAVYDGLWIFHALASCAFIGYVPVKRLVHTCATPMGRLMNSQVRLLRAKKLAIAAGLARRGAGKASG